MNPTTDSNIYASPAKFGDTNNTLLLKLCYQIQSGSIKTTAGAAVAGSGQPYGSSQATITNVAAGPSVVVFKDSTGATLKTRTYTYTNSGASPTDVLTGWADT